MNQSKKLADATDALRNADQQLLGQYGLTGVGVGLKVVNGEVTDEPCIKMFVQRKLPGAAIPKNLAIPRRLTGTKITTDVEELPVVTSPPWRAPEIEHSDHRLLADRRRYRPVAGGQSVSHALGTLGTVTAIVVDAAAPARRSVLSCNHVLAQLNHGLFGEAVVQPAKGDGGAMPGDTCGVLTRYVPIRFSTTGVPNYVDAAIARLLVASADLESAAATPYGVRSGNTLAPGEAVYKVGRTTGLSRGTVIATHVSLWISYPAVLGGADAGYALFREQIMTTGIAGFGDSGSLVLDGQQRAVGMLFGGSATRTLVNDITIVEKQLGVKLILAG